MIWISTPMGEGATDQSRISYQIGKFEIFSFVVGLNVFVENWVEKCAIWKKVT